MDGLTVILAVVVMALLLATLAMFGLAVLEAYARCGCERCREEDSEKGGLR